MNQVLNVDHWKMNLTWCSIFGFGFKRWVLVGDKKIYFGFLILKTEEWDINLIKKQFSELYSLNISFIFLLLKRQKNILYSRKKIKLY